MIGFPSRTRCAPASPCRTIDRARAIAFPSALGRTDVAPAPPADAGVALPHLLADVAWTAAQLPFVYARVATERPPRPLHDRSTPPAHGLAGFVAIGLPPVVRRDTASTNGAHAGRYRRQGRGALANVDWRALSADCNCQLANGDRSGDWRFGDWRLAIGDWRLAIGDCERPIAIATLQSPIAVATQQSPVVNALVTPQQRA